MNKNKLSRFLLSTSVGIITALGVSEVYAGELDKQNAATTGQAQEIATHRAAAINFLQAQGQTMTDAKALELANKIVLDSSGLSALNSLGDQTHKLFEHFKDILIGGIELTPDHFDSFLSQISDAATLRVLGVDSIRDLKSPEAERLAVPAQITTVKDAIYFAEQRKDSGEFETSAQFFLKARDLTEATNATLRTEYSEKALLMYSEHFIHHVARVSSVTEENVTAAQTLLASVKALAVSTNTAKAYLRAASCAEELGTAIYDLALKQIAARDILTDATAIAAAEEKISKAYIALYNADIVARDMHESVAAKSSGQAKNKELVAAANAMRLAIGALADAQARTPAINFSNDVSFATKLNDDAIAFKAMYTGLDDASGVGAAETLKTLSAASQILLSKYKATWNARSQFISGTSQYNDLDTQYTEIGTFITDTLASADIQYSNINATEQYLSSRDIVAVRSVRAEMLYRGVLDVAAVSPIVEANVTNAIGALIDYVALPNGPSVGDVVNDLDTALKSTLDEVKASAIRSARTECNRTLANSYALIAKARSKQLIVNDTVATSANRAGWVDSYLYYARLANNKAAWEAGVEAADTLLAVAAISTAAADPERLVKALALTAKAEALLKRNTVADDTLVATVDATGALTAGLLFDANAVAAAILDASRASRVTARDHLRKAFESAVELHNSAAVKQGLRTVWATVESGYAADKLAEMDATLTAAVGTSTRQELNSDTWAAILGCFTAGADAEAVKGAIRDALFTTLGVITGVADSAASRRAALVANTLAKYFNDKDVAIDATFAAATPANHEWYTVEGLFNDLKKEFDRITALSTGPYSGYKAAAEAFDKARKAKSDWAAAEVDGLSSVAVSATWTTKRDAAGDAYVAAADYETKRAGALLSAAGIGKYSDYDTLAKIAGLDISAATAYVTEDVLESLHRRAVSLKSSADTYNRTLAASGANAAVAANDASRNAAVAAAVRGGNTGAYEVALKLVNSAYQGLAGFNAAAGLGTFVGERLAAITAAYRKINAAWLDDLKATIALNAVGAAAHRAALQTLIQDGGAIDGTVVTNIADCIFKLGALFDGTPYTRTHSALRDIGSGYETVLRTLEALGTTAVNLEAHQGFVYAALKKNAEDAKAITLTAYTAAVPPVTIQQMNDVITQLTERADLAEAVVSAAYGALRSNTPSNTDKSFKAARAQAITAITGLIQEGGMDFADIVLKEESGVATADIKAKVAHQLGRLLMAKAASERIRFDNLGVVADKDLARDYYLDAIAALKKEISAILSQSNAALMIGRNTRLAAAYEKLSDAYNQAILNGADAALVKEQYTAIFNQAQILYREGGSGRDRSAKILEGLSDTKSGAVVIHGTILKELAEQYEAAGRFLQAAKIYKSSTQNHVAQKNAAAAYEAAENALKAAQQCGHSEACVAAADSFNLIGSTVGFHGRVRSEAYQKAAEAYILGELFEEASVAYSSSGSEWAKIGDHMQAGNQYEKAAWALSNIKSVTIEQRVEIIEAIEKAAHQLQIADATVRLEKLVLLAEEQIKVIQGTNNSISELKLAVISAAGAMYEKALAFQKEGDLNHAQTAQQRIEELLKIISVDGKEASIQANVAKLYSLQNKYAAAANTYIKAAESYVLSDKLLDAANAYADAADAILAAGEGNRIKAEILPALLDISASVRAGGSKSGRSDQFDIHLAVVEVYRDLAKLNPSELDNALAEVEAILKEAPTQKDMQARIAGVKIDLLTQKANTLKSDDAKAALLKEAQTAFDGVKGLMGETTSANVKVKKFVAIAANALVKMYELTRVIHTANGLVYLDAFRAIIDTAEAASAAAFDAASTTKMSYDIALEAAAATAKAMESYTKAMLHYSISTTGKGRSSDMTYLNGMPDRANAIVEKAVRETLLGILKSREEAAAIQENFVLVLDASNKIGTYIVALRKNAVVNDSHGDATKVTELKATMSTTAAAVKGASGDLKDQAAAAQALAPVERAAATDALVASKVEVMASAVTVGMSTQSTLVTKAPAASSDGKVLIDHAQSVLDTVIGDGKATGGNTKGLVGDLQSAQGGPSTSANAVINTRS